LCCCVRRLFFVVPTPHTEKERGDQRHHPTDTHTQHTLSLCVWVGSSRCCCSIFFLVCSNKNYYRVPGYTLQ
jgi:hypothetical protein